VLLAHRAAWLGEGTFMDDGHTGGMHHSFGHGFHDQEHEECEEHMEEREEEHSNEDHDEDDDHCGMTGYILSSPEREESWGRGPLP